VLGVLLTKTLNQQLQQPNFFRNLETDGSVHNIQLVEEGVAQLGFTVDGLQPADHIRSLARLYDSPLHVVVRRDRGIRSIEDLKNKTIFVGPLKSGTRIVSLYVLSHYGLNAEHGDVKIVPGDGGWSEGLSDLKQNLVDAAFFLIGFNSDVMKEIASDGQFDLLTIDRSAGIVAARPAFDMAEIPPGSYASRISFPSTRIYTIASREILICNESLSDGETYRIVKGLVESSSTLIRAFPLLTQLSRTDPERGFFYELDPGAAKFYRRSSAPGLNYYALLSALATSLSIFTAFQLISRSFRARKFRGALFGTQRFDEVMRIREVDKILNCAREAYARRAIGKDDFEALRELAAIQNEGVQPPAPPETGVSPRRPT
jgi:TRAP transporter TAXI family solute receptor